MICQDGDWRLCRRFAEVRAEDIAEANRRYDIISPCLNDKLPTEVIAERTLRRWMKKWRDAKQRYGCGYIGLLPQKRKRGNRKPKLPEKVHHIMKDFLANQHENFAQKTKSEMYDLLVQTCKKQRLMAPSYKTFTRAAKQRFCKTVHSPHQEKPFCLDMNRLQQKTFTLPTTRKGTAKVIAPLGVKINYIYYRAPIFHEPQVKNSQVPVRFDPNDAGIAYVFIKGNWLKCISEYHDSFAGRTHREIQQAITKLRMENQRNRRKITITARKIADLL